MLVESSNRRIHVGTFSVTLGVTTRDTLTQGA